MQSFKKSFSKMFGQIFRQPFHKSLKEYRIATIFVLIFSLDIMYRLLAIIEEGNKLSEGQQIAAVVGLATALMTAIWRGISNLAEMHKKDFE